MGWDMIVESPVKTRHDLARRTLDTAYVQEGMTLVAQGYAGMGKTYFLRELMALAQADGRWTVTYVTADIFERDEPYGFLERLLSGSALRIPDRNPLDGTQKQPISVARELLRHANIATTVPQVIIVDDAQWVDTESALVLRYLLPRLTHRNMLVAFGVRTPHTPGGFGEHLEQPVSDNPRNRLVTFEPLTAEEIRLLAHARLGRSISPRNAERLRNSTGGSFLHIASIFDHLTEDEISRLHLTWDIPLRTVHPTKNPLLIGYDSLSESTKATTEIVCMSGGMTRSELSRAASELDEPVSLDEALTEGVLKESGFGATVIPTHALVAHAVQDALPRARSRAISRVLAKLTDGFRSVRYALNAADRLDEDLLQQVREYVAQATETSAFANINTVLEAALELVDTDQREAREELLVSLGLVNLRNKTFFLLLHRYDEYQQLNDDFVHELLAIALSAYHPEVPFPQERAMQLLQRQATSADEITVQAYLALLIVIMNMRTMDYTHVPTLLAHAKTMQQYVPAEPTALQDERLAWMADPAGHMAILQGFETVLLHRKYDIDGTRAAIPELRRSIDALPDGSNKADATTILAGAAAQIGEIALAKQLAAKANGLLDRVHKPWMAGTTRLILADSQVLLGEYESAYEFITAIEEISYDAIDLETRPMFTALQAIIASITDRSGAQELTNESLVLHEFEWEGYGPDLAVLAQCEYARAHDDPAAVLAAIDATPVDSMVNTKRGFLTFQTHALIELGGLDEAAELVETLRQWRGTRWHECWGTLSWLEARLAQHRGDTATSEEHYRAALAAKDFPLPLALTHLDFGEFLIETHRIADARTQLLHAQSLLQKIGARAYLPRVQRALSGLDSAGREARSALLAALTAREREIAEHLANQRSNQQIAESLVISNATVRFHVSNVLRKLELTSRKDVAGLLRD